MPSDSLLTSIIALSRDSPSIAIAIIIIICGCAVALKLVPAIADYYDGRTVREKEREIRKKNESAGRSKLEGQWLEAQRQSTEAIETSNRISSKLLSKLDDDRKRNERIEGKLDQIKVDIAIIKNER